MTSSNSDPESSQPIPWRFRPARTRDKLLGVLIGTGVALLVAGLAWWILGSPPH